MANVERIHDFYQKKLGWLPDQLHGGYALTHKGEPETGSAISRKSIAAFIATLVENPELQRNENLGISKPR